MKSFDTAQYQPLRMTTAFDSAVLCQEGTPAHLKKNLRILVMLWELADIPEGKNERYREQMSQLYDHTEELARAVSRTGLLEPPGRVVTQMVLKQQPQVSSICMN